MISLEKSPTHEVNVDQWGNIYVTDLGNGRIMCWSKGSKDGRVAVGGNGGRG